MLVTPYFARLAVESPFRPALLKAPCRSAVRQRGRRRRCAGGRAARRGRLRRPRRRGTRVRPARRRRAGRARRRAELSQRDLIAGERVAGAGSLARARDHAGRVQGLQVLGGVRRRLRAGARKFVDGARCLRGQVQELEAAGTGAGLAHQGDGFNECVLLSSSAHACIFNRSFLARQAMMSSTIRRQDARRMGSATRSG